MTHSSIKSPLLTKIKPLVTGTLKAAIVAAPFMLAAPSEAVTVPFVTTGFTGQFAPSSWTLSPTVSGSKAEFVTSNSALQLTKSAANTPTASATIRLDAAFFNSLKPAGLGPLVSYSYKYNYDWNFAAFGTNFVATNSDFAFKSVTTPAGNVFNTSAPKTGLFTYSSVGASDSIMGISLANLNSRNGNGFGSIRDFEFTAVYEIPGPLPILGAGAAFAWSRKLRRRLKFSSELV
jgi:hypothetical protein